MALAALPFMKILPTPPLPGFIDRLAPPTPRELLNDLKALISDTELLVTSAVSEHSAEAIEALRARLALAEERFTKLYALSRENLMAGARCTDTAIRENPYRSLAITFGAGLLAGLLIARRN
jgi:ElaB/YqjD/DUF883 family membrane-anchored ribosome-binding protein